MRAVGVPGHHRRLHFRSSDSLTTAPRFKVCATKYFLPRPTIPRRVATALFMSGQLPGPYQGAQAMADDDCGGDGGTPPEAAHQPIRLLLSRQVASEYAGQLDHALAGRSYQVIHLEEAAKDPAAAGFDIAFFSRDIHTGLSKTASEPLAPIFFRLLKAQTDLKWLHVFPAGIDHPIYAALQGRGVTLTTSAGATSTTVAHAALAGILALARKLPTCMQQQQEGVWSPLRDEMAPRDLPGQHAIVVGPGRIGSEVARLLRAFGMTVTGISRTGAPNDSCTRVVDIAALYSVLPEADWLVLCCPLTSQTRGMIDRHALSRLPRGAHLVNVARGEVVVENALIETLLSGHLAGAYLDVFTREPLEQASSLWRLKNVLITPHTAADSDRYHDRVVAIFLRNLALWAKGRPMENQATLPA